MAAPRINMRKLRNILRLRLDSKLSIRQIHTSTQVSVGAIQKLLSKASELNLSWPLPDDLDDHQLAQLFYSQADTRSSCKLEIPDWREVYQELKHKNMTLQLLWEEYVARFPNRCLSYSRYCARFRKWQGQKNVPCAKSTKPVKNVLLITAGQRCPLLIRTQEKSARHKYL